jgi:hypothetical protein
MCNVNSRRQGYRNCSIAYVNTLRLGIWIDRVNAMQANNLVPSDTNQAPSIQSRSQVSLSSIRIQSCRFSSFPFNSSDHTRNQNQVSGIQKNCGKFAVKVNVRFFSLRIHEICFLQHCVHDRFLYHYYVPHRLLLT